MANVEIELGPERLVINDDVFTVSKVRELRAAIKAVGKAYDDELEAQKKAVNEVVEEYSSRLKREVDEETGVSSETDKEYSERIKDPLAERDKKIEEIVPEDSEAPTMKLAFECLKAIASITGQAQKVTPPNFDKVNWGKCKIKLAKFLISNECDLGLIFLPPRQL